jgi:hypothetical protein
MTLKQDGAQSKNPPIAGINKIGQFQRLTTKPVAKTRYLDKAVDLTDAGHKVQGKPLYSGRFRDRYIVADGAGHPFRVYAYRVRAVNKLGVVSGPSPFFLTVPGAVEGLFSKEDGTRVHLKWSARPEKKLTGYLVYRMNNRYDKTFPRLTGRPIDATSFTDDKAGAGKPNIRRYFVVAVDALGQEGIPSSPVWSYREWHKYYTPFGAGIGTWHQ